VCGLVVLRSSDPSATHAWYVSFFSSSSSSSPSATPRPAPRSRWHFTKERRERTRRGCGRRQRGEIYYGARGRAVADLILRSAARTSRPWCSRLMHALGYLWRRSGGRMALWSTDVLRPPKFDAGPPSIGYPKREQN
jgi:hypothetical protein